MNRSLRFRVLARDKFTCRYCGAKAPDVVLEVDHIQPRSHGGLDRMLNLVTSCYDCNQGKRDMLLDIDLVALVTPAPVEEPRRKHREKVTRKAKQPRITRREPFPPPPLPVGFGHRPPYIAPDKPASSWRCSACGMLCELEGDVCSCARQRFRCSECREVMEDADGYEDGLCITCYEDREVMCVECYVQERVEGNDYCEDCAANLEVELIRE